MNGKAHMLVNIGTGVGLVGLGYAYNLPPDYIAALAIGSVVGTVITPDYDFDRNLPKSIIGRIPLLGYAWNAFWSPYAKAVKHRSFISHSPFFSTTFRLLYLVVGGGAILYLIDLLAGTNLLYESIQLFDVTANPQFWTLVFLAWCVEDLSHLLLDTKLFRIFKRRK